jgi:hypothetical protein
MIIKGNGIKKWNICQFVCLILLTILGGCAKPADLTLTNPYAQIVGTEYRIVAAVDAYGIYEDLDKKVISYITLIPGVGIGGPEVAFKKRIAKGQKIKILSAFRDRKFLYNDIYYVIALQGADLPRGIQARIDLSRGNEGVGAELNQRVYEKITGSK